MVVGVVLCRAHFDEFRADPSGLVSADLRHGIGGAMAAAGRAAPDWATLEVIEYPAGLTPFDVVRGRA